MADRADNVARIEAIPNLGQRLRAATEQMAISKREVDELGRLRKAVIMQMRGQGLSFAQIADEAGLSRGRIHQILNSAPAPEARLFGRSPVTIAIPLRILPGREEEPVISSEDSRAHESLAALLADLGLQSQRFGIPPNGAWTPLTHAGGVVAICGPKSSPVTAAAIATDPVLTFEPDASGHWVIQDRKSGHVYESPIDTKRRRTEDVAYLARLSVRGHQVLFVAGVHSLGSVGAVDYLAHNLEALYSEVGDRNFSMVVASKHNGTTVTKSEAICPARIH